MQRNWTGRFAATFVAALVLFPLASATAADGKAEEAKSVNEEILEILRKEGAIDQRRYDELMAKDAVEQKEEASDPKDFTVGYSNGLRFSRNDGLVKMKLGGRIQADFASIHTEDGLDNSVPGGDGEGAEFRRARLYMSGEFANRIIFKAQYDLAPNTLAFNDVYIGMKNLGTVLGTVKVGNFKQPFGLEEMSSSKYVLFMELGLPNAFSPSRDFGLGFESHDPNQRVTWALGIFAPSSSHGASFSHRTKLDLTGRVTALPYYADEGEHVLHLGFGVSQQFRDNASARFRSRPEVHLAQRYWDTGSIRTDHNTLLAAELAWVCGPFSLQAEWKHALLNVKRDNISGSMVGGQGTSSIGGGYVHASYFVTGEHRNYNRKNGTFGRVSPLRPFDPRSGDWGAIQLAARFSYLELNDSGLYGGKGLSATAGINWHLYSNLRIIANYVYTNVDTGPSLTSRGGDIHVAQARAQLEF